MGSSRGMSDGEAPGERDVYIATQDAGLTFEAKHVWQRLPDSSGISAGRKEARKAALQIQSHTTDKRYAATFVVPFFASGEALGGVHLEKWVESQIAALNPQNESYGYYFPTLQPGQLENHQGYTYPGVMLLLEEVT